MAGADSENSLALLRTMASDTALDDRTRARARTVLSWIETRDMTEAARKGAVTRPTAKKYVATFETEGWQGLLTVPSPRGGDFLARYDQGYWAERLARAWLDTSRHARAVPYGTSRSEPFSDLSTFRKHAVDDFLLQAWSSAQKWKRPDLLMIPRSFLRHEAGNDEWTPDLLHSDNVRCRPFLERATAGIEVETSLWQVSRASVSLSFTVKEEDLEALRAWVVGAGLPLYVLQVFFDEAHALAFNRLESLIGPEAPPHRKVSPEVDRITKKATYKIPLSEGIRLGGIPEPEVEGRIFKSPNGRVTVYGRLTGSEIAAEDRNVVEALAKGELAREDLP